MKHRGLNDPPPYIDVARYDDRLQILREYSVEAVSRRLKELPTNVCMPDDNYDFDICEEPVDLSMAATARITFDR
jgi:hypothetical protein